VSRRAAGGLRLGLLGGTFDPPHVGHLLLAEAAREQLRLDRILFVPASVPPHKRGRPVTPARTRRALLAAALRGTGFGLSTIELDRPGPSYTVDTLESFARTQSGARLFLLIGADSLNDLPTWRDPERILSLATVAVAVRPGTPLAGLGRASLVRHKGAITFLGNPPVDVSSTRLRARVAAGRSIRFLVPAAVERTIARLGLYQRGRS
jgi:nicotinate-nucleotide adenylyltransferase